MQKKHWLTIARILALVVVIGISVFVYSIRDQAEKFAVYGYPGVFIIAFLANATVLLPAPGGRNSDFRLSHGQIDIPRPTSSSPNTHGIYRLYSTAHSNYGQCKQ